MILLAGAALVPATSANAGMELGGPTGGWSSFRLRLEGDSLLLRVESASDGPVSFGFDLYRESELPFLALRILSDDGSFTGSLGHEELVFTVGAPGEVFAAGSSGWMSALSRGFPCSSWTMRLWLDATRYELELGGCAFTGEELRGIEYGAGDRIGGRGWAIEADQGSSLARVESSPSQFVVTPEDFEGTWLAATGAPAEVLWSEAQAISIPAGSFAGTFEIKTAGIGGPIAHRYESPTGTFECPCGIIADAGRAGERTFSIEGAQNVGAVRFLLAGVDARLPP